MNDEQQDPKRLLTMAVVFLAVFVGFQYYYSIKYPNMGQPPPATAEQQPGSPDAAPSTGTGASTAPATGDGQVAVDPNATESEPAPQVPILPADQLTFKNDVITYIFDQSTGGLRSAILEDYRDKLGPESQRLELLDSPMLLQGVATADPAGAYEGVLAAQRTDNGITFTHTSGSFEITQTYTLPAEGFGFDFKVDYRNAGTASQELTAAVQMREFIKPRASSGGFLPGMPTPQVQVIRSVDGSDERSPVMGYCEEKDEDIPVQKATIDYFGYDLHYFLKVLEPKTKGFSFDAHRFRETAEGCSLALVGSQDFGFVKPGETVSLNFRAFLGPKDLEILREENAAMTNAVDFGMFAFLAEPLLLAIKVLHGMTNNYGVAIVILTLLLKILFYPLMKASSVSMHKMKKLNPQMQEMREKYKDDRAKQQQELMKFMSQHKINPAKGCLPILPQIPVFFAYYQVLMYAIELRHAPFFGWIQDLSVMDPYYVTPILMGIAMFGQQKLTPTTGMDKTQEKIMMFMPVMFTAMMLSLPAGMTLYILVNTVTSIAQQKYLYMKLDKQEEAT